MSDLTLRDQIELREMKRKFVAIGLSEEDAEQAFASRDAREKLMEAGGQAAKKTMAAIAKLEQELQEQGGAEGAAKRLEEAQKRQEEAVKRIIGNQKDEV